MKKIYFAFLTTLLLSLFTACSPSVNISENASLYNTWSVNDSNIPSKYIINENGTASFIYDYNIPGYEMHIVMNSTYTINEKKISFDITDCYNGDKKVDISALKFILGSMNTNYPASYKFSIKGKTLNLINTTDNSKITCSLKEYNKAIANTWTSYVSSSDNKMPESDKLWSYKLTPDGFVKMTRPYSIEKNTEEEPVTETGDDVCEGIWDCTGNKIKIQIFKAELQGETLTGDDLEDLKSKYSFEDKIVMVKDNVLYLSNSLDYIENIFIDSSDLDSFKKPSLNAIVGKWKSSQNLTNYNYEFSDNGSVIIQTGLIKNCGVWNYENGRISITLNEIYNPNTNSWGASLVKGYEYNCLENNAILIFSDDADNYTFAVKQ